MSSLQDIKTTTGIEIQGSVEIHRVVDTHPNTSTTAGKKPRVWERFCTVNAPTPNFAGREDLIAKIHRQIQQCSLEKEYYKKIVVIHGLGGIGKSELVRKYVHLHLQDPFILNAAWIDAQSKNSLKSSFKSLAEQLNLQPKDKKVKNVVSSVYNHLADHSQPSLFIFDNAQQMCSDRNVFRIFDFLPTSQLDTIPLIIITARDNNWGIPKENIIQVNEFSEDAAVEFLTKRFRLSPKQKHDEMIMDALKTLAQNLQCFPLGLTLAASNIPHSKLRSIPKEIEYYIQKLNSPCRSWIHNRHSSAASNYELIMDNVWAATLEKIQSHGEIGEAAISILNLLAYLPPKEIAVENVVTVAEFCGLPTIAEGIEMLEMYSLISLSSRTNDDSDLQDERSDSEGTGNVGSDSKICNSNDSDDECRDINDATYQYIRIHRLVQRCTRDKLDREKNYSYLLNISRSLAHQNDYVFDRRAIHQHLKERMWPENSIQFSICFASYYLTIEYKFNIVKDVHEALVREEKPNYAHNLTEDYKILHTLNLFSVSTYDDDYKKICGDLISKDPSYSTKHLEQVFVSSLGKCVKDLFVGTIDMEDVVKRASINVLIRTFRKIGSLLPSSKEVQEEISVKLADATSNSFEGSMETVGLLYRLLEKICCFYKNISGSWYVETVFKIHGSVYARICKTGGARFDSYWKNDKPIRYEDILRELMDSSDVEWTHCFAESFRTEAGLQLLLEHLQYLDTLTQTKIYIMPTSAIYVLEFIMLLGWHWDSTKKFVRANLFMETLYSITKNIFKCIERDLHEGQLQCLLTWFGLFGKNTFVDRNGVSWSIQSVEKEMILFLDTMDSASGTKPLYSSLNRKASAVLNEFIESSGSDQESIAVKTATRMLEYFK